MERIETTYADLRPTDLVIDKAGNAWPVKIIGGAIDEDYPEVTFWLRDPVTKVNAHLVVKAKVDPVTVSRIPSRADEAAKLEAEFPVPRYIEEAIASLSEDDSFATMEEAVAAVEEIGGTVEAEVTAAEVDAASAATEDAPITLPPFADMTPLERRSHLYLLHGIYATDVRSNDELVDMHQQAHAGAVVSKTVPHVHTVS